MTLKRRENKNLVIFICFSFLVISFSNNCLLCQFVYLLKASGTTKELNLKVRCQS